VKKLDVLLQTDYPPEVCMQRLYETIDAQRRAFFSPSAYQGNRAVVGILHPPEFRLQKRGYGRNDFAPVLYGKMIAAGEGTRIEGFFDMRYSTRLFMRFWLVLVAIFGVLVVHSFWFAPGSARGNSAMSLLLPAAMLFYGWLLPRLGSYLSFGERAFLTEFLERNLVAHRDSYGREERS
jgi:hypothetical protein